MKRSSFFQKLLTSYVLVIILLTVLIYSFSFTIIKNNQVENLREQLFDSAVLLRETFRTQLLSENDSSLDSLSRRYGNEIHKRITIVSKSGLVLADSEENPKDMDNHINRIEIQEAKKSGRGYSIRYSLTIKSDMLYLAIPLKNTNGEIVAYIRTSLWMTDVDKLIRELRSEFFTSVFYMLLIAIVFSFFFTKTMSDPIRRLVEFSRKLPKENFETRIELRNETELGVLADSFNLMANEVKKLFDSLQKEKEELNGIINNVKEGLLVIAKDGKIILANRSLKKTIGKDPIKAKFYWEVISNPKFKELINLRVREKTYLSEEIEINNRFFRVSMSYLPVNEESICIFHDITEAKKLEATKRDFVSNVSHELRTPLTAIKGFVETLMEEETSETKKHYLEIINRNSDRLIALVKDLSTLSNLESDIVSLEIHPTNFKELLLNVEKIYIQQLQEKQIHFQIDCPENLLMPIDTFKMEQVIINLIDNAIKYADASEINVAVKETPRFFRVNVKDNGNGIEQVHLERLFERFYVANKARSRKQGGTGLGLSIVKHIVQLHKGTIKIKSEHSNGTEFIIHIPKHV